MKLADLRAQVCAANRRLVAERLVTLTWGNVSGLDRDAGLMAIKPSGVAYDALTPEAIVMVDLDGRVVDGDGRPSCDTPTHLELYRRFPQALGVTHTHSAKATAFAQARRPIPCLGTTHADHFAGPVPVARALTEVEAGADYERNTGRVIADLFADDPELDPAITPGVLVAGHAPFAWGPSAGKSVDNAVALEACAAMALDTFTLCGGPDATPGLEGYVLDKHHQRKHGPAAYYGQSPEQAEHPK
ncbi:MAG: L-ribulose-5-phosphate 4-epimerase AraD [Planctomycetota bacterium]